MFNKISDNVYQVDDVVVTRDMGDVNLSELKNVRKIILIQNFGNEIADEIYLLDEQKRVKKIKTHV